MHNIGGVLVSEVSNQSMSCRLISIPAYIPIQVRGQVGGRVEGQYADDDMRPSSPR
jgi:hypothetical protein